MGLEADGREWISPEEGGCDSLGAIATTQVAVAKVVGEQTRESGLSGANVRELRRADRLDVTPLGIHARERDADRNQAIRFRQVIRPEHDAVDQAEDQRVRADAEAE
jgi:hypothetical protein